MPTTEQAGLPSWETVLGAVEQDVRRTEALLVLAVADPGDPAEADAVMLAEQLMSAGAAAELPPLQLMPLVPANLLERIQGLRRRISEVRAELEAAMTANRQKLAETTTVTRLSVAGAPARYIDTVA